MAVIDVTGSWELGVFYVGLMIVAFIMGHACGRHEERDEERLRKIRDRFNQRGG